MIVSTPSFLDKPVRYRPDIDGLRAVAVLSVVFYHLGLRFPGGYVGVDVFFVISGYLITELILKQLRLNEFDLVEFWVRRIRRIFPAFFVVVFLTLLAGSFLLFPADLQLLARSVLAQVALAANFFFLMHCGYFIGTSDLPLLHTWSLAVEEQFYLFFPFFLLATKHLSRRRLIVTSIIVGLASLLLSIYGSYFYSDATFYLLPSRAWELLLGGILAMLPHVRPPRWVAETVAWTGLFGIGFALAFYNGGTRFPGLAALPPCAGAAALIWANGALRTTAGAILSWPPVVFIGLISYSLYLWHWPLLVYTRYWTFGHITHVQSFAILGASLVLSVISWKWVETPFRRRVWLKSRWDLLAVAGLAVALLLIAGLVIDRSGGFPSRFSPRVLALLKGTDDHGIQAQLSLRDAINGRFVKLGDAGNSDSSPRVLLWGDSHAMALLPAVDALCRQHNVVGFAATHSATAPLLGFESDFGYALKWDSIPYNQAVLSFIQNEHIPDVLLVGMWSNYLGKTEQVHTGLLQTIKALRNSGARVWVMRQVPIPSWDVPGTLARFEVLDAARSADPQFPHDEWQASRQLDDQILEGVSAAGATILDPTALLTDAKGEMILQEDNKPLYTDGAHLSVTGAMKLRPLLEPIFETTPSLAPAPPK